MVFVHELLHLMGFQWFSMVANHWSNNGMVTMVFQYFHQPCIDPNCITMVFGAATIAPDGF